jgi:Transposase zinc-binding domain
VSIFNPPSGFARIRCPDCRSEHLLMFSCKTRGFCPSCHAKRREEWGQWVREILLLDVPHRQVVLTIPKTLWTVCPFWKGKAVSATAHAVVDRIIRHLELTFVAEKPPPAYALEQVALMAAEESGEYE